MSEQPSNYETSSGHGHVTPRRDGVKARCGGPAICSVCAKEQAQMIAVHQQRQAREPPPSEQPAAMTPERLAEIRKRAASFSGLQYVVVDSQFQWPWTSASATNQVVDLVRAIPGLLDRIAVAETALAALDRHPTPVDQAGNCWYCSGGLGHGPNGHSSDCPLAAIRKLAPAAEGERDV